MNTDMLNFGEEVLTRDTLAARYHGLQEGSNAHQVIIQPAAGVRQAMYSNPLLV